MDGHFGWLTPPPFPLVFAPRFALFPSLCSIVLLILSSNNTLNESFSRMQSSQLLRTFTTFFPPLPLLVGGPFILHLFH